MKNRRLWNDNWYFAKTEPEVTWEEREKWEALMKPVDIPHDWLIYNTLDLYENSAGWYRRELILEDCVSKRSDEAAWEGADITYWNGDGRIRLRFEGVYMDSTLYVNGQLVGEWKYGYSTFDFDITDYVEWGHNEVVLRVVHLAPNSRWYSGAGIYRNVWLITLPKVHIPLDGVYVSTREEENGYRMLVDTELCWGAMCDEENRYWLEYALYRKENCSDRNDESTEVRELLPVFVERRQLSCGQERDSNSFLVDNPARWDISEPNLYQLQVCLVQSAGPEKFLVMQTELVNVGFRTIAYLPERGFLLNGRKVRLNGACDHHDLGALGAAFSKVAMRRKLLMMRSMGVNAIRTSHNMPAVELMELADEMGFLVLSEAFDMWEITKNPYDYGRFFKEWADKDVRSWIRRDRNHPSVIMWSIGNEIPDTHVDAHGQEITRTLVEAVRKWDYRENAPITIGSNYMPWENAQKCADIVKLAGYNYAEKYYGEHHEKYPDWIIYGSETSSVVQSRGIYHFPLERANLIEEDEQCSALGNSTTSWGAKSAEYCLTMDRDAEYSCGQFIWTAFDYIGEPTPYQTKNSYFGQIDTAGFPKDAYYLYQAEWTDYRENPMVHVYPYWDFNEGQLVDVRACSNGAQVELFVNGRSMGRQGIDHKHGTVLQPHWKVPYEAGSIWAVAYDEQGNEIARKERHSFGDSAALVLKTDKTVMQADGQDMIFVEISTVDTDGHPVENAADYVRVSVSGAGRLVGLDNGDSTDYDQYKGTVRKLFQGKLLAMIAAKTEPGEILLEVQPFNTIPEAGSLVEEVSGDLAAAMEKSGQIVGAKLRLQAIAAPVLKGISANGENTELPLADVEYGFVPVRKIELFVEHNGTVEHFDTEEGVKELHCRNRLTKEEPSCMVHASIYPCNATDTSVIWKIADAGGMESRIARLEIAQDGRSAKVIGLGDGKIYVRCMSRNGTGKVKLISQLDMEIEGMGEAFVNPYEAVAGAAYASCKGDVSRGPANSVGTDKEGETWLTYDNLDLGSYGSNEVTLSIFANDEDVHRIQLWQGIPYEEQSVLLGDVFYQKPPIWEVFQPESYQLSQRVCGVQTITVVTHDKLFLNDFSFAKQEKAFERLEVAHTAVIYGDSYEKKPEAVEHIGNNVSFVYEDMNFGEKGAAGITICGRTPLSKNTIQMRISGDTEGMQLLEFPHSEEYICESFSLEPVRGAVQITFVFLPGCNFDFKWFRFEE